MGFHMRGPTPCTAVSAQAPALASGRVERTKRGARVMDWNVVLVSVARHQSSWSDSPGRPPILLVIVCSGANEFTHFFKKAS